MLKEFLQDIPVDLPEEKNSAFEGVATHSKKVHKNNLYLAMAGNSPLAEQYLKEAIQREASAILCDSPEFTQYPNVIHIPELKKNSNKLLNRYFGFPGRSYFSVGVTGTNGKSTISHLVSSLLNKNGNKTVLLGTIENRIGTDVLPAELTTPDAVDLMGYLKMGREKGCSHLVMEASSHALDQGRLSELEFDRAIFTNLTQDHLDYHQNFENYFNAKSLLFTKYLKADGLALINMTSEYGLRLADSLKSNVIGFTAEKVKKLCFPTVELSSSRLTMEGTQLQIDFEGKSYQFYSQLLGQINVENLLATIAMGFSLDYSESQIQKGIESVFVPGRNQVFNLKNGGIAVVDYAHTPDALERVLKSFRPLVKGKLLCVFGCGGDRDKTKRPLMAKVAEEIADEVCITNDNPRTENPKEILSDILKGIQDPKNVNVELDREKAIIAMLQKLNGEDCVIVAGKGHEDYQILGKEKIFFSDSHVIQNWISSNSGEMA